MDELTQLKDPLTYRWSGIVLKWGLNASFGCMLVGLLWWLLAGSPGERAVITRAMPVDRVVGELLSGNPVALMNLGLLLLLATPTSTLLVVFAAYLAVRNWRLAGIALVVIAILSAGLAIALGWIRLF